MKQLFLLRHAKSSWADIGVDDRNRTLNKRGLRDARRMGKRFYGRDDIVDQIITSPATRARMTSELFGKACGYAVENIVEDSGLYFFGSDSVDEVLARQDDNIESLMLVFHNPLITSLVNSIASADYISNVPTCGLISLFGKVKHWRDWSMPEAQFDYFDYPKKHDD